MSGVLKIAGVLGCLLSKVDQFVEAGVSHFPSPVHQVLPVDGIFTDTAEQTIRSRLHHVSVPWGLRRHHLARH
jgi:hypothetical protein